MKIALVILGLGGNQPVTKQVGLKGGTYSFIYDRARGGHAIEYDLAKEGEAERYNREMADLLNQRLHWPILAYVLPAEAREGEIGLDKALADLKDSEERCVEHSCRITELEAELAREKTLNVAKGEVGETAGEAVAVIGISATDIVALVRRNIREALDKELELEDALTAIEKDLVAHEAARETREKDAKRAEENISEKVEQFLSAGIPARDAVSQVHDLTQGGEEASRRAHNSESAGSSPAPGTPPEAGGGEGDAGSTTEVGAEAMTVSEAAATLGNGVPEPEDSEAAKVLAKAGKDAGTRKKGAKKKA